MNKNGMIQNTIPGHWFRKPKGKSAECGNKLGHMAGGTCFFIEESAVEGIALQIRRDVFRGDKPRVGEGGDGVEGEGDAHQDVAGGDDDAGARQDGDGLEVHEDEADGDAGDEEELRVRGGWEDRR